MANSVKTLFVIGAGCSRNYDCSNNGIEGLLSPINVDFFSMAKKVLLKTEIDASSKILLKQLFEQICIERGLNFDDNYQFLENPAFNDLEDVMTDVDVRSSLFESLFTVRNHKHPSSVLVELIAFIINRALCGPPCTLHRKLAAVIQENDVILDFNYDLLLDEALRAEHKLNDFGYTVDFFKVREKNEWRKPDEAEKSLTLFKLHGSTNWLKCIECSCTLLTKEANLPNPAFDPCSLAKMRCPKCLSEESVIRLLLPPIQTKEYNLEPYRFLWRHAAQQLKGIKRIAFLGYSFANTDFATRSLLRRLYKDTSIGDLKVHFMNPSSRPEELFKVYFPKTRTPSRTRDLKEFIEFYEKW